MPPPGSLGVPRGRVSDREVRVIVALADGGDHA
jgi:hypothetical protein